MSVLVNIAGISMCLIQYVEKIAQSVSCLSSFYLNLDLRVGI